MRPQVRSSGFGVGFDAIVSHLVAQALDVLSGMSPVREQYLSAMGIPVWVQRGNDVAEIGELPISSLSWLDLADRARRCTDCALHSTRTQVVFGTGSVDADLLIVGEAPGAEEDKRGEPFVGPAGRLLDSMLQAIVLSRAEVYIANILKCRPPNNRDPGSDEAASCTPYLERQIELLQPKVILALGSIAAQWLLQSDAPIGRLRGRKLTFGALDTPLIASYHPAYLLRSPAAKAKSWEDLRLVIEILRAAP
jgi:uracil-DNA glycosylase family 4